LVKLIQPEVRFEDENAPNLIFAGAQGAPP